MQQKKQTKTRTIHPSDTTVAYSTVVRIGRFISLTMTAHCVRRNSIFEQTSHWHSFLRDASRICKHSLDMTRQRQSTNGSINYRNVIRQMPPLRQERNRNHRIDDQNPDHRAHDCAHLITVVHPDSILSTCSKRTIPRFIVEIIKIIFLIVVIDFGTKYLYTRSAATTRGVLLLTVIVERRPDPFPSKGF